MTELEIKQLDPVWIVIKIYDLPKATNALLGASYWIKHNNAKKWKSLVRRAIGAFKCEPMTEVTLYLTRHSWRMLDYDGCVASFKPVVDSLVECKVLHNDTYKITGDWIVTQKFRPKKEGSFIEIGVKGWKD